MKFKNCKKIELLIKSSEPQNSLPITKSLMFSNSDLIITNENIIILINEIESGVKTTVGRNFLISEIHKFKITQY